MVSSADKDLWFSFEYLMAFFFTSSFLWRPFKRTLDTNGLSVHGRRDLSGRLTVAPWLCNDCGELFTVHIHVPPSPSSIIWYRPKGGDAQRLGRYRRPDRKYSGSLRVDYPAPGSAPQPKKITLCFYRVSILISI